jgi:hypothetical protein
MSGNSTGEKRLCSAHRAKHLLDAIIEGLVGVDDGFSIGDRFELRLYFEIEREPSVARRMGGIEIKTPPR